jgi:starch phosphorylase
MNKPLTNAEANEIIAGLKKLSRNLWWTWTQEAQDFFSELSPRGWQNMFHNAVAVLHEVSDQELRARLQDAAFAGRARAVLKEFETYLKDPKT